MLKNIIICMGFTLLAMAAAANAFGSVAKRKQPELALSNPFFHDGIAAETASSNAIKKLLEENKGKFTDVPKVVSALATQSFLSEPTTSESIAILALSQNKNRRALMQKAHILSKREALVTGWLISDESEEGNIDDLLNYYDISIRTSVASANLLLPIMVGTLSRDEFIEPYYKMLIKNPPWANQFWRRASSSAPAAKNSALLRKRLFGKNINPSVYADKKLILTLVANYDFQEAINLRSFLISNGQNKNDAFKERQEVLNNHDFSKTSLYGPVDWQVFSNGEYGASLTDNKLYLSAIRNSGGIFARQIIYLSPKIYAIRAVLDKAITNDNEMSLQLECAENKENKPSKITIKIRDKETSQSIDNRQNLCQYYWFNINGRTSENEAGLEVIVENLSIRVVS